MSEDYGVLEEMLKVVGPSCFESDIQEVFQNIMLPYVDRVYQDSVGNCYAEIGGDKSLPKMMYNAHSDTVGFMVKHIDDRGFLFTDDIAGCFSTDFRNLPGNKLWVHGRKKNEFYAAKFVPIIPIHKLSEEELGESLDRPELAIDIGARSLEQAKRYISIGDYAAFEPTQRYFGFNGNRWLEGANLDDRAGLFVMYELAQSVHNSKAKKKCPVTFVSTVAEENGNGAAGVAAVNVKPDIAFTIDVTTATDQIRDSNDDYVAKQYGFISLDSGPAISRGFGIHDGVFTFLEDLAHKKKIPLQIEVGGAGTENEYIQIGGHGAKSGLISMPARYCHTPVETISLTDLDNTVKLSLEAYREISRGKFW